MGHTFGLQLKKKPAKMATYESESGERLQLTLTCHWLLLRKARMEVKPSEPRKVSSELALRWIGQMSMDSIFCGRVEAALTSSTETQETWVLLPHAASLYHFR